MYLYIYVCCVSVQYGPLCCQSCTRSSSSWVCALFSGRPVQYTLTHFSTNLCAVSGRPVQFSKLEYSTFSNALTFENLYQFFSCAFPKFSSALAPPFTVNSLCSWLLRFSCQVTCICLAANKKLKSLSYPSFYILHAVASCLSRICAIWSPFCGAINFDSCAKLIATQYLNL